MRKINVAITVDDNLGIAFNGRRQSRDKEVINDLVSCTRGKIYVSHYSAPLFKGFEDKIEVVESPLESCPDGESCFVEISALSPFVDAINSLTVYRWNRNYPSDEKMDLTLSSERFRLISMSEFAGSSHDKISKGIYKKLG